MIQIPDPGGTKMGDLYEVIEEIGKGGYGSVYKARDKSTNQLYALKKVKTFDLRQATPPSFFRETECLRALHDCDNILSLHSIFRCHESNCFYLVLELCDCDLSEVIHNRYFSQNFMNKDPTLSILQSINEDVIINETIRNYMQQILLGISKLHLKGFVHRDIKPSNILLKFDESNSNLSFGTIKIADFGLSRNLMKSLNTRSTRTLTPRVATLSYRAPELLLGSTNYDQSIDVWSLGCLFFEMITGKALFHATSNARYNQNISHQLNGTPLSEFAQLNKIFEICGTPNDQIWNDIPNADLIAAMPKHQSIISEILDSTLPSSFRPIKDLLMLMLQLDPKKRITVTDALKHPFFIAPPFSASSPIFNLTKQINQQQKHLNYSTSDFSSSSPSEGEQNYSNSSISYLSFKNEKNNINLLDKTLYIQNFKDDNHIHALSKERRIISDYQSLQPDKITPPEINLF